MSVPGANTDDRDAQLLTLDLSELDNDISRREEWMVSQTLFTGKIVCLDGDTNEIVAEVDYTPITTSVVNPLWSSASTCDPLKDLKTAMRLVTGACGFSADLIVMGKDPAMRSRTLTKFSRPMISNTSRRARSLLRWPSMESHCWATIGDCRSTRASRNTPMSMEARSISFQPDKVLVAASGLQGTLAYAGIVQVDEEASSMHPYEATRVPLVYYEKGYDFRKLRLSSRPIPIPADTQSWTVLDVI